MKDQLIKAASLLREAASKLRETESPEKTAASVVDDMVSKGFLSPAERMRYTSYLATNPEKLAHMRENLELLPARVSAPIAEVDVYGTKEAGSIDAFDRFLHN